MATDIRQQINQMPVTHFVLIGIILSATYYYLMFEGSSKYENRIKNLNSQIDKINGDIAANKNVVKDISKFEEEVNQISEQFQSAIEYLPSKSKVEDVLDQLYRIARTKGVILSKVVPGGTTKKKFYEELVVDIQVSGSYSAITGFIVEVSQIPRIINIHGISLKPSSRKSLTDDLLLDLSGKLVTYRYIEGAN
ncbi:MAG: type 4a pilus biogenesis protein PilO [Bdellovibrionota bacterium]|nr:type 4a pilus biogenesis protein PilO [Bdellovibrionota bacterium]